MNYIHSYTNGKIKTKECKREKNQWNILLNVSHGIMWIVIYSGELKWNLKRSAFDDHLIKASRG